MIKTASKANLFFLELIIMLLILSLSMAVCTQVFFAAQKTADHSRDLSNAVARVQSAAACYKEAGGDLAQTARFMSVAGGTGELNVFYDRKWQLLATDQGAYRLRISEEAQYAVISMVRLEDQETIYYIKVKAVAYEQ